MEEESKTKVAFPSDYRKVEVREIADPKVGPHEILFKVIACGVCPNDYGTYSGPVTWRKPPASVEIGPNLIHHSEVSIIGSYNKTRVDRREATRLIDGGSLTSRR